MEAFLGVYILAALLGGLVSACFCGWLAKEKGRESELWFALGFFFGPLALLALGLSPKLDTSTSQDNSDRKFSPELPTDKVCPRCRENIKFEAIVCRFCGYEFGEENVAKSVSEFHRAIAGAVEREEARQRAETEANTARIQSIQQADDLANKRRLLDYMGDWRRHTQFGHDISYLKRLIEAGAPVNFQSLFLNVTPLHLAARYRSDEIVLMLLANGAHVNAVDRLNRSPLDYAKLASLPSVAAILLAAGALSGKEIVAEIEKKRSEQAAFIKFLCRGCHKELTVPAKYAGKSGTCNHCGVETTVPYASPTLRALHLLWPVNWLTLGTAASIIIIAFILVTNNSAPPKNSDAVNPDTPRATIQDTTASSKITEGPILVPSFFDSILADLQEKGSDVTCEEIQSAMKSIPQEDWGRLEETLKDREVDWRGRVIGTKSLGLTGHFNLLLDLDEKPDTYDDTDVSFSVTAFDAAILPVGKQLEFQGTIERISGLPTTCQLHLIGVTYKSADKK